MQMDMHRKRKQNKTPLHPVRMSMPMICRNTYIPCQDILQHLLYSGSSGPLLHSLITQCILNIGRDFPSPGVKAALSSFAVPADSSLTLLRVVFLVLLNYDSKMRCALCEQRFLPHIPELCPYKACRFYDHIKDRVILDWIKNETIGVAELVENLKESYLVS